MISTEELTVWAREYIRPRDYRIYVDGQKSPLRLDYETADEAKRFLEHMGHWVELELASDT